MPRRFIPKELRTPLCSLCGAAYFRGHWPEHAESEEHRSAVQAAVEQVMARIKRP